MIALFLLPDMTANIIKIGNSKGVIIPASMLKQLSLHNGDEIIISIEDDKLVIRKNMEFTGSFTGPFAALEPFKDAWGDKDPVEIAEELRSGSGNREIPEW